MSEAKYYKGITYGRFFDVTNYLRQKRDGLKGVQG